MELIIDRVTKRYENKIAVDRISLKLHKGVYGLLGANGAGKTTLMRMLCGILKPTEGTIALDGMDVSEENYRAVLGYLPQDFGYYPEFTGLDFLLLMSFKHCICHSRESGLLPLELHTGPIRLWYSGFFSSLKF